MTDDDIIMPGAVRAVLDRLSGTVDLVVVDAEVRNVDFSRMYVKRRLATPVDVTYAPQEFEEFFVNVADHLSFVGAMIIKRSEWLIRDKQPYIGTGFVHVGVVFQRPFSGQVAVIARPLVRIRFGNALWSSRSFAIWNVGWPALIWSFRFSDEAKCKVVPREPWRSIRKLVEFRMVGAYSIRQYQEIIAPRLKSRWSFLPGLWVAYLPIMPLKVAAGVRRLVRTGSWH